MKKPSGISKLNQNQINQLHMAIDHTLTVNEAAIILKISPKGTAKLMARWVKQGRFSRIRRGLYAPIKEGETVQNDPWVTVTKIYYPSYIGALSAAEYWGLGNKKFSNVAVLTPMKPKNRNPVINGISFSIRTISERAMFGLKPIMRGQTEVLVSDPSRTIIDFLVDPKLGAGIYNVIDILNNYLNSEHKNMNVLYRYAVQLGNGAVLKRLGYLLERCESCEFNTIKKFQVLMGAWQIKLDPEIGGDRLITRWGLWVPKAW